MYVLCLCLFPQLHCSLVLYSLPLPLSLSSFLLIFILLLFLLCRTISLSLFHPSFFSCSSRCFWCDIIVYSSCPLFSHLSLLSLNFLPPAVSSLLLQYFFPSWSKGFLSFFAVCDWLVLYKKGIPRPESLVFKDLFTSFSLTASLCVLMFVLPKVVREEVSREWMREKTLYARKEKHV